MKEKSCEQYITFKFNDSFVYKNIQQNISKLLVFDSTMD